MFVLLLATFALILNANAVLSGDDWVIPSNANSARYHPVSSVWSSDDAVDKTPFHPAVVSAFAYAENIDKWVTSSLRRTDASERVSPTPGNFSDSVYVDVSGLEGDDELYGYGVMSVAAGEAHLLNLCVHTDRQRFGLGSDLLRYFLGKAKEADAERIFLEVRQTNHAALALYNRAGFKAAGLRRNYYRAPEGREDAIVLSLAIDQD